MIDISIPGLGRLQLQHLILDYNGTIAHDGQLVSGVRECLIELAERIQVHVITADTFGTAATSLQAIPCRLSVITESDQHIQKRDYVRQLGVEHAVCIGNGKNDALMLSEAQIGIALVSTEGAAVDTLRCADVVCIDIVSALGLLLHPLRLVATLRT